MTLLVRLGLTLALVVAQKDVLSFESPRFGFSIRRPSDAWVALPAENQDAAKFVLSIYRRGSEGLPSVVIYVYDANAKTTPESAADATQKKLEAAKATEIARSARKIGGVDAISLRAREPSPLGGEMSLECDFLVQHDFLYAFQIANPFGDAAARKELDLAVDSFALREPKVEPESAEHAKWRELASHCASDLGWCANWSAAAERAKAEDKLVLVVFQSYGPLEIPKTARSGPFMDPDFGSLVKSRFVPLELDLHDDAPFRAAANYGMGKNSFGTAFLFVDASGRVVAETGFQNASYLDEFARSLLPARPANEPPSAPDALERARIALANGELALATKALGRESSTEAHRLRAAIARRERDGDREHAELAAGLLLDDKEVEPELVADQAVLDMHLGDRDGARKEFADLIKRFPKHERSCEAAFWLGAFDLAKGDAAASKARWSGLIETHAESPWAAKAAANLIGEGAFACGAEKLEWPSRELLASVARSKPAALGASELERAVREGRAWLLAHQREDGSWWNPMDGFSFDSALYTPAITSICAASLIPSIAEKGVRPAVERSLTWMLERHASKAFEPGPTLAGVYSIWSRVYALEFFIAAKRAHLGDEAKLASAIDQLAQSISSSQDHRGGWPYITLPGDPKSENFDPSASFLTAAALFALIDAREASATVDEDSITHGLDFIARAAQPDGTYRYMPEVPGERVDQDRPEAAGRGPVCALALFEGKRADREVLARALQLFASHRSEFKAEWHKTLCHTSPTGFGAHYIAFDYLHAARAVHELDAADRAPLRAALIDDLLASRFEDGSFEDLPGLGRAYATAMALETLRALE